MTASVSFLPSPRANSTAAATTAASASRSGEVAARMSPPLRYASRNCSAESRNASISFGCSCAT